MNNEIIKVIRSVLKEEFEPIHKRLGDIEQDMKYLTTGQTKLGNDVIDLKNGQVKLGHKAAMIEQSINELKNEQKENHKSVIRYLGDYSEKITDHFDNKTDALNKRVFAVETELQRLSKQ
jgi:uncharacterized phage infection (PIP) family protein YhgE